MSKNLYIISGCNGVHSRNRPYCVVTIAPLLCNNCALVLFFVVYDKMERFVFYRNIKDKIG